MFLTLDETATDGIVIISFYLRLFPFEYLRSLNLRLDAKPYFVIRLVLHKD